MTDQLDRVETYEYDLNDNLIKVTDRKGQTTVYTYDRLNRIVRVDYADGSYTTYTYDAVGRLTYINDSISGPIEYVYSDTGCSVGCGGVTDKVVQEITPLGSISYTYDALGRRTSMTVAGQPVVNYEYDPAGRLTRINTAIGGLGTLNFEFSYDALGRRTSLTYPNGVTTTYTYDNASRLLSLEHLNPLNQILEKIGYTYDKNGNRIAMDRLNVTPKLPTPYVSATYNEANQLLTFQPENDVVWDLSYDENGNLTQQTQGTQTTVFSYNGANRLESVILPDGRTATYTYDPFGRRIKKDVDGQVTYYLYADEGLIGEYDETGTLIRAYGWLPDTLWGTNPVFLYENGSYYFYHNDHLGTPQKITDIDGNEVWSAEYTAFGEATVTGSLTNNLRFPGQYYDQETGLHYNLHRYYNPVTGRYTQVDPIGFIVGDVNLYRYARGNPARLKDPYGLFGLYSAFGYKGKCESWMSCMNRCTRDTSLANILGVSDTFLGDLLLGNDLMGLSNYSYNLAANFDLNNLINTATQPGWQSVVSLPLGYVIPNLMNIDKTVTRVLSHEGFHSFIRQGANKWGKWTLDPTKRPPGWTNLYQKIKMFPRLAKVGRIINPIGKIKLAWDIPTWGVCAIGCAGN